MPHREHHRHSQPVRRRRWVPLVLLVALAAAGIPLYRSLRPSPPAPPVLAEAREVRSTVVQRGDSLQVAVDWDMSRGGRAVPAESLRVEVRVDSGGATAARRRVHPASQRRDTLYLPAPKPGTTAEGLSCVATLHRVVASRETCTAWRYVRPAAGEAPAPDTAKPPAGRRQAAAATSRAARIIVQPSGMQVDPDIGGRCAAWQRQNPNASVWIEVNRTAVPACTGLNRRPTVAQFCAFAELADGRRVKTANSANNPYCDQLFRAWIRERVS